MWFGMGGASLVPKWQGKFRVVSEFAKVAESIRVSDSMFHFLKSIAFEGISRMPLLTHTTLTLETDNYSATIASGSTTLWIAS